VIAVTLEKSIHFEWLYIDDVKSPGQIFGILIRDFYFFLEFETNVKRGG
jgi:hypothetical protein